MLSTFTSPPPRRRGAQPGNANARKHGFYARRDPSPIVEQFIHIEFLRQSALLASRARQLDLLQLHVQTLQELLYENFLRAGDSHLDSDTILHIDRFFRTVSVTLRAKRALKKLLDELNFLPNLARDALPLCTAEFTDRRISPYAFYGANFHCQEPRSGDVAISSFSDPRPIEPTSEIFVPRLLRKNRALSAGDHPLPERPAQPAPFQSREGPEFQPLTVNHQLASGSRSTVNRPTDDCPLTTDNREASLWDWFALTSSQWHILEPVMTSLRLQLAEMGIRQRQRTFSDRFLLESILTRLAFGLRWDDLRGQVPVRACQLLYKQLCTSGRMRLVYELLYEHLLSEGGISLAEMIAGGTFAHIGDRIFLTNEQPVSWQRVAGLLLLQRALYNRRRIQRAETQARRRRGGYQREPSISRSRSSRSRAAYRSGRSSPAPGPIPGLLPISDCRSTNPLLFDKLGSVSSGLKSRSP